MYSSFTFIIYIFAWVFLYLFIWLKSKFALDGLNHRDLISMCLFFSVLGKYFAAAIEKYRRLMKIFGFKFKTTVQKKYEMWFSFNRFDIHWKLGPCVKCVCFIRHHRTSYRNHIQFEFEHTPFDEVKPIPIYTRNLNNRRTCQFICKCLHFFYSSVALHSKLNCYWNSETSCFWNWA